MLRIIKSNSLYIFQTTYHIQRPASVLW